MTLGFGMFKDSHYHIQHAEQNARQAIAMHDIKLFETSMNKIKSFFSQGDSQQEAIKSFENILSILQPNYKHFLLDKCDDPDTLNKLSLTTLFERGIANTHAGAPAAGFERSTENTEAEAQSAGESKAHTM